MTVAIGGLHVGITGDSTKLVASLRSAQAALTSTQAKVNQSAAALEKGFRSLGSTVLKVTEGFAGSRNAALGLIGAFGIGAFAELIHKTLETASAMVDMADRIGISTDALQGLSYAAKQSGVSADTLESGLTRLNRVIAETGSGSTTILTQLGIQARDSTGNYRPLLDVLYELADRYAAAGSSAAKAKILNDALGKGASQAALLFKDGAAGIKALVDEANQLGIVLDERLLRGAKSATDALDRLGSVADANVKRALLTLAPQIEGLANFLAEAAVHLKDFVETWNAFFGTDSNNDIDRISADIAKLTVELDKLRAAEQAEANAGLLHKLFTFGGVGADFSGAIKEIEGRIAILRQLQEDIVEKGLFDKGNPPKPPPPPNFGTPKKDELADYIASLREEVQLAQTDGEAHDVLAAIQRAENIAREQGIKLTDAQRQTITAYIQLIRIANDANQQHKKDLQDAKQLTEELRTPQQVYNDQVARLNQLLREGLITQETYNRGLEEAKKKLEETDPALKTYHEAMDEIGQAFEQFGQSLLETGKIGKDAFKQLIDAITQTIVKMYILKPLIDSLFGSNGSGGILGNLLGIGGGGLGSTVGGGIGSGAEASAVAFAGGGSFKVGGSGGTDSQLMMFRATPGEMVDVRTPGQDRGPVGGNQVVIIHNNTDAQATAQQGVGPNGEQQIEVMIDRVVGKAISRRGSNTNKALTETFRQVPVLAKR